MSNNQFVDILLNMLLTPKSDFYISKLLYSADKKSLDPCVISSIDLGVTEVFGVQFAILVKDLEVKGLSDTQVRIDAQNKPDIVVVDNEVTFHAKQPNTQEGYQRPPDVPAQVEAVGSLHITVGGEVMPPGTFKVVIKSTDPIQGVFKVVEAVAGDIDSVNIVFSALSIHPATSNGNISVVADLQTSFIGVINDVLNSEKNLLALIADINEHVSTPQILSSISEKATQFARQALSKIGRDVVGVKNAEIPGYELYDFAVVVPLQLLNKCVVSVFPYIMSQCTGTLTDPGANVSVEFSLVSPPSIIGRFVNDASTLNHVGFAFSLLLTVRSAGGEVQAVSAMATGEVNVIQRSGQLVAVSGGALELTVVPSNDPFLKAVLNAKKSDLISYIDKTLSLLHVSTLLPGIFPRMTPLEAVTKPTKIPYLTDRFVFGAHNAFAAMPMNDPPRLLSEPVNLMSTGHDIFRVQLAFSVIDKIAREQFWDPLPKEFSDSGAKVTLSDFKLSAVGTIITLSVSISGTVRPSVPLVPDPEWGIYPSGTLQVRVEVYINQSNELRLRYVDSVVPKITLNPNNAAAEVYGALIPGLAAIVQIVVGGAVVDKISELITNFDKPILKIPSGTFVVGNKRVTLVPDNLDLTFYSFNVEAFMLTGTIKTSVTST